LREDTKKFLKELFQGGYKASTIGLVLVFSIFIGGFIGYLLDNYFGTDYIFKMIGFVFGVVAGFRQVYLMGKKYK
jgi:F0F1-type ATP synthase assembly protein I